jgi:hypothetical protein
MAMRVEWVFLAIMMCLTAPEVQAQRPTARIADHRFLESDLVPLPIITTNLVTSLGAGSATDLQVEVFDRIDSIPPRTIEGDLAYLALDLTYQQAVNDWLAPWLGIQILGRIGTSSVSIISEGVSYQTAWDLGWLIRVAEWDRSRLGMTVNLWNSNWGFIRLDEWLSNVIDDGEIEEDNEVYQESLSLAGGVGVRYAHAINETFGLAALVEGGIGEPPQDNPEAKGFFRGAIIGDIDLNPVRRVPIGVALGFRYETFPGLDPNVTWRASNGLLRIEYTGRSEYAVALETMMGSLPLTGGGSTNVVQTRLVTRYYF